MFYYIVFVDDDNDEHYDDDDENDDNDNDQSDDDDNYYEHYDDDDEKPGLVARAWLPLTGWPGKKRTVHALSPSSSLSPSLSSSFLSSNDNDRH